MPGCTGHYNPLCCQIYIDRSAAKFTQNLWITGFYWPWHNLWPLCWKVLASVKSRILNFPGEITDPPIWFVEDDNWSVWSHVLTICAIYRNLENVSRSLKQQKLNSRLARGLWQNSNTFSMHAQKSPDTWSKDQYQYISVMPFFLCSCIFYYS